MGLKAAAFVVAAGVGAYLVYTMMGDKSPTPSSTATPAQLYPAAKKSTSVAEPSQPDALQEPEPHESPPTEPLTKAHNPISAVFAKALSSSVESVVHEAFHFGHLFTANKGTKAIESVGRASRGGDRVAAESVGRAGQAMEKVVHKMNPVPTGRSEHWLEAHGMA